jgi:hypothetical protein
MPDQLSGIGVSTAGLPRTGGRDRSNVRVRTRTCIAAAERHRSRRDQVEQRAHAAAPHPPVAMNPATDGCATLSHQEPGSRSRYRVATESATCAGYPPPRRSGGSDEGRYSRNGGRRRSVLDRYRQIPDSPFPAAMIGHAPPPVEVRGTSLETKAPDGSGRPGSLSRYGCCATYSTSSGGTCGVNLEEPVMPSQWRELTIRPS